MEKQYYRKGKMVCHNLIIEYMKKNAYTVEIPKGFIIQRRLWEEYLTFKKGTTPLSLEVEMLKVINPREITETSFKEFVEGYCIKEQFQEVDVISPTTGHSILNFYQIWEGGK